MSEVLHQYLKQRSKLNSDTFAQIRSRFQRRKIARDHFLLLEGAVCQQMYFVEQGCLRIYATNEKLQELIRYFVFPEKFGTALTSFIQQKASQEYIQAVEDSIILSIHRRDFYELVETEPVLNRVYRDILEMAYCTSQERIYNFQGKRALERLQWLLDYQPDIFARLSNQMIAAYLGVTPYTLSRLKAELKKH